MRYFLDTEFNGFGGELISLALFPEYPERADAFYVVVPHKEPTDPWVARHVLPKLNALPSNRIAAALVLAEFLREVNDPTIVADWPTDFEHLMRFLIAGPGEMIPVPDFKMEFCRMAGFDTASHSKIPHNALADAEALRDEWVRRNRK